MSETGPELAALMPLKVSGRHYGDNLGRLDILLSSLLHFAEPGLLDTLLVVTPAQEAPVVRRYFARWPEFDASVVVEEDHFPAFRRYQRPWQVRPWQRQQVIKLATPELTSAPFVLTLDPDVFAVQMVSRELLLPGGRALLEPEPRAVHPTWWRASADVLDLPRDPDGPGIGVTPALLSCEILTSLHRRIEAVSGRPWMDTLLTTYDDWTEYSLYLLEAQRSGLLDDFHVWSGRDDAPVRLQVSPERSVWSRHEPSAQGISQLFDGEDSGLFAVVQSNAGIPAAEVAEVVASAIPLRVTATDAPEVRGTSAPPGVRARPVERTWLRERTRTASRLVASRLQSVRREARRRRVRRRGTP